MLHSNQFLAHLARAVKPTCGARHCVCPSLKGHHHNTCQQQSNTLLQGAGIHLLQGAGPCTTTEYLVGLVSDRERAHTTGQQRPLIMRC